MKGFANPSQPFTKLTVCILMSYGIFVKGEGLTDEFFAIGDPFSILNIIFLPYLFCKIFVASAMKVCNAFL